MATTEQDRQLFRFFDGAGERRADPLKIAQLLRSDPELTEECIKLANVDDPEVANLHQQKIFRATRRAFGVVEFDEQAGVGLTEQETMDLFNAFSQFCEQLKKNGRTPPTSPAVTQESSAAEST